MKSTVCHARPEDLPAKHKAEHPDYEYTRRDFVPRGSSEHTLVSIYEIPPGKSAIRTTTIIRRRRLSTSCEAKER